MTREKLPADASIEQQLAMLLTKFEASVPKASGWQPPPHFLPHLDRLLRHNREHPEARLGARKIAAWLGRNGVQVSKDIIHRWLKKRSRSLDYEMQSTPTVRR